MLSAIANSLDTEARGSSCRETVDPIKDETPMVDGSNRQKKKKKKREE
jgi:hypothetical protein